MPYTTDFLLSRDKALCTFNKTYKSCSNHAGPSNKQDVKITYRLSNDDDDDDEDNTVRLIIGLFSGTCTKSINGTV